MSEIAGVEAEAEAEAETAIAIAIAVGERSTQLAPASEMRVRADIAR